MKHYTNMTEDDYKKVKLLLEAKLDRKAITQITGRSNYVINMVSNTPDWGGYVKRRDAESKATMERRKAKLNGGVPLVKNPEITESEDPKPLFYSPAEQSAIELTRIANALERLADAWEASPRAVVHQPAKPSFFANRKY